jgi:transcription initiation factor TFIIB
VTVRHETYCDACGVLVSDRPLDRGPTLADLGAGADRDSQSSIERHSPYFIDKRGSTFSFSYFDANGNALSSRQLALVRRMERRQCWERDSREELLTDALHDIRTMGATAGLPRFVCERATQLFRQAFEAGLPGGRMSYESLSAGAAVVAAREAGCPQSIEMIIRDSRTSLERGCAGARKVRLGLDLVESSPPGRQDAVQTVLDALRDELTEEDLHSVGHRAAELLQQADEHRIGPGTTRLTIAAAAVYVAAKAAGVRLTQSAVVEAVSPITETTTGRISRYGCELRDTADTSSRC